MTVMPRSWHAALLVASLFYCSGLTADAQQDVNALPASVTSSASQMNPYPPCVIPSDLDDPAFARHVDLLLLGTAWDNHDAALMTDVGLQLAEGERILMRPHKAVKSEQVIELATYLAGARKDKPTLLRIKKVAESRKDQQLMTLVAQQFPACDFRPENTRVLISHFANSLCIMLSQIHYLTTCTTGVARHGTCSR